MMLVNLSKNENKQLIAINNLLFKPRYFPQLHSNAHKKKQRMKLLHLTNNEGKNSEKDLSKIEARFAKQKQKTNSFKKC